MLKKNSKSTTTISHESQNELKIFAVNFHFIYHSLVVTESVLQLNLRKFDEKYAFVKIHRMTTPRIYNMRDEPQTKHVHCISSIDMSYVASSSTMSVFPSLLLTQLILQLHNLYLNSIDFVQSV